MLKKSSLPRTSPRIALALAGGGPMGAVYEIGALCALDESFDGLNLTQLDHYVGVSAGGFIAAAMANGMRPRELCASFVENAGQASEVFDPAVLMHPAWDEFLRRTVAAPGLIASAIWGFTFGGKSLLHALERVGPILPAGVFSGEGVENRVAQLFSQPGRTNDFRQLKTKLTLVATNLDSAEAAPFGRPGWDHVPISRAVQASSALPGLFPPVEIDDSYYVDGALKKTLHASVALEDGVDLLLCLNPLVPFDATAAAWQPVMRRGLPEDRQSIPRIVDGGLPAVLSQTFRAMIHSRIELGMKSYERSHPDTDIVLFEPDHRDPELFLANTFSYSQRRAIAEHAYQQTRQFLRSRKTSLGPKLARHGIRLNMAALEDPRRHLITEQKPKTRLGQAISSLEETLNDLNYSFSPQKLA